jgi:hypothetical protein
MEGAGGGPVSGMMEHTAIDSFTSIAVDGFLSPSACLAPGHAINASPHPSHRTARPPAADGVDEVDA